jgi:hypothetical protein
MDASIPVTIIESRLQRFFSQLQSRGITEVPLRQDYYWHVPDGEIFEFSKEPGLHVGSLKDDLELLAKLDMDDAEFSWLELGHIGSLLRLLESELEKI